MSGTFGATILTDAKNGSDKPDDHTLRLTLIRTPASQVVIPTRPPRTSATTNLTTASLATPTAGAMRRPIGRRNV
jgi:hypothetical protein